ncbi:MAG: CopG family transcriptional regulator [Xenococcaceae cyanobacterium MO_207.B15]|nr:CopG family transcriptional regulator [Xenococcaceae cyanobacterium MO_207.B15]MDJ0745466.1 CopG family transcriptional regulator [Xenococcaceae cyanobacterium MO_167.B27]
MASKKISISLPASQIRFIEQYQNNKQCKSRSQVIEEALQLLQEKELEAAYHLASQEIDSDWDVTIADGLSDETW